MQKVESSPVNNAAVIKKKRVKWNDFVLFLYVLPGLAYIIIFNYLPLWGWSYSLFSYKVGRALFDCEFVGVRNFTALFGNAVLRGNLFRVLRNTLMMYLLGQLFSPVSPLFAVFLTEVKSKAFQKVTQTLTTLPHFISWVIMYSLMLSIFAYNGLVNNILLDLGLISEAKNYLASDQNVWLTQVLLQQWKNFGWGAIVYFAAIAGIDQELYEAAMVDGAGRMRRVWHITLPHLIPTYFVLLVMSIGRVLNTGVDQFLVFGNALNKNHIETLDLYVYNLGIGSGQISYSVAVSIMKTFVALVMFSSANWASKLVREGQSLF